jgi:simple sugar transport system ATP-binding protein
VGERQRIEIVRCLLQNPRLLIMDEPTSVLTPQEVERLFETLRQLSAEGVSILYISHKLEEIRALCDRATILRGGKVVGSCDPARETAKSMASMMIGTEMRDLSRRAGTKSDKIRLEVQGLNLDAGHALGVSLKDVTFSVSQGEIFGIAGVAGNGQGELFQALTGERTVHVAQEILIDGTAAGRMGAAGRRRLGMCSIPEERHGHAAVPDMSLAENFLLSGYRRMKLLAGGFIRAHATAEQAQRVVRDFNVKATGVAATAGSLSGGNLQKFIVGREIQQNPLVLVVSQPTWGLDAGAAAAIHEALFALAGKGTAIVVISQDLDELLTLSDHLAVINMGTLSKSMVTADASIDEIGLLMGGLHGMTEHQPGQMEGGADVA